MTLASFKEKLKNSTLEESFYIFLCAENTFLADQYVSAMCESLGLEKLIIKSIFDQDSAVSLIMPFDNNLKVLYTDEFAELTSDYSRFTNTVVICSKIDKKVAARTEDYTIDFPKLLDWQVKEYARAICPGLSDNDLNLLYSGTDGNIYRIDNELAKIKLFPIEEQSNILQALKDSDAFAKFSLAPYEFINRLLALQAEFHGTNQRMLVEFFKNQKLCTYNIYGLVNSIIPKLKYNLLTKYYTGANALTAEDLDVTDGQLYNIKTKEAPIEYEYLKYLINVMSEIDLKVKSGELDMSSERQLDYFVTRVLNYVR